MRQDAPTPEQETNNPKTSLGLWDTTSLIVGIVIGAGIFETPSSIFHNTTYLWQALGLWVIGGFLSFVGALCFAELATTFPRSGGEYVYLGRGYGSWLGFLFAWAQFAILRPAGSVGFIAFLTAIFAGAVIGIDNTEWWKEHLGLDPGLWKSKFYIMVAAGAVAVFTVLNILGVKFGKTTQNILTSLKMIGIVGIVVVGFLAFFSGKAESTTTIVTGTLVKHTNKGFTLKEGERETAFSLSEKFKVKLKGSFKDPKTKQPYTLQVIQEEKPVRIIVKKGTHSALQVEETSPPLSGLVSAMVLVMLTYGGWHEAGYVASELNHKKRTIPRSLMLGTSAILIIYLLMNLAYAYGLGFVAAGESQGIAAELFESVVGPMGAKVISILMLISALGGLNGTIFTTSRIYNEMGKDHPLFAPLGKWNDHLGTPVTSLVLQGIITIGMIVAVGTWFEGIAGFDAMGRCSAAVFWLFFLLTGISLFVLRYLYPNVERPFKVPLYPFTPLIFSLLSLGMMTSALIGLWEPSLVGLVILLVGLPLFGISEFLRRLRKPKSDPSENDNALSLDSD